MNPALPTHARIGARGLRLSALIYLLLALPVFLAALCAATGIVNLPYELTLVDQRLPVTFRTHMLASAFALVLIPCAIASHGLRVHGLLGRSAAFLVLLGGVTAVPVAIASEASALAQAGFLMQALAWIALVSTAVVAIRRRNRTRHMWLMLAVAAVASGAFWLRLAGWAAIKLGLPFEAVYAMLAWLSWLLPLCSIYLMAMYRAGDAVHFAQSAHRLKA